MTAPSIPREPGSATTGSGTRLLHLVAVLWVVWGLVHMFAGVMTMARDTADAVGGIADAVEPAVLDIEYPDAVGAIVDQHGFNLFWIGAVTLICAAFIWRGSMPAAFLAALVGGLADVGYFVFLDLGGHVNFVPGTVMTIVSATAIIATVIVHRTRSPEPATDVSRSR
ncbi:MAG: hypothetical protein AAF480_12545 [Actinomycetota bacterium]